MVYKKSISIENKKVNKILNNNRFVNVGISNRKLYFFTFYLNRDTKGWPSHSDSEDIPMIPVLCRMRVFVSNYLQKVGIRAVVIVMRKWLLIAKLTNKMKSFVSLFICPTLLKKNRRKLKQRIFTHGVE